MLLHRPCFSFQFCLAVGVPLFSSHTQSKGILLTALGVAHYDSYLFTLCSLLGQLQEWSFAHGWFCVGHVMVSWSSGCVWCSFGCVMDCFFTLFQGFFGQVMAMLPFLSCLCCLLGRCWLQIKTMHCVCLHCSVCCHVKKIYSVMLLKLSFYFLHLLDWRKQWSNRGEF